MNYLIPNANPKSAPRPVDAHEALIWLQQCIKDHDSDAIRSFQKTNDHFTLVNLKTSLSEFWCYINLEKNDSKFPITACLLLHLAAYVGDIQTFEAITELYQSVYSSFNDVAIFKKIGTTNGNNLLHLAILNNRDKNHEIVKALLKYMPALANDENHDTELPLELAYKTGKTELLRELFDFTSVKKELSGELSATLTRMQQEAFDVNNEIQGLLKRFKALDGKQFYTLYRKDGYYVLEPNYMMQEGVERCINLLNNLAKNSNKNKKDYATTIKEVTSYLSLYEGELSDTKQAIKITDQLTTIVQDLRDFLNLPIHSDIVAIKRALLALGYEEKIEVFDLPIFDKRGATYDELKSFMMFVNNIYFQTNAVAKKAQTTVQRSNLETIFDILEQYIFISGVDNDNQIFKLPARVDNLFLGEYKNLKAMQAVMDKWEAYYCEIRDLNAFFKKINRSDRISKDLLVILNKQEDQDKISRSIHESKQVKANYDWLASTHASLFQLLMAFYQSGDNGEESVEEPPYFAFFKEIVKDLASIPDKKKAEFFIKEAKSVFYTNVKGLSNAANSRMKSFVEEQINNLGKNPKLTETKVISEVDVAFVNQKTMMTRKIDEYSVLLKKMKVLAGFDDTYNHTSRIYDEVRSLSRTLENSEKDVKKAKNMQDLEALYPAADDFNDKLKLSYEKLCNVFDLKLRWLGDRLTKIASLVEEYIAEPIDIKQHWGYESLIEAKEKFISEIQNYDYKDFEKLANNLRDKIDSKFTEAIHIQLEYTKILDNLKPTKNAIKHVIKKINLRYKEIRSIISKASENQQLLNKLEPILKGVQVDIQNLLNKKIFQTVETQSNPKSKLENQFVIPRIQVAKFKNFPSLIYKVTDTNIAISDFATKLKTNLNKIKKIIEKDNDQARKEEEDALKSAKECYKLSLTKLIDLLELISYLNPKVHEEFKEKIANILKVTNQADLNTPIKASDLLKKLDNVEKVNEFGKDLELAMADASEIWQSILNKIVAEKINTFCLKFSTLVNSRKDPITFNDKYKNIKNFTGLFVESNYSEDLVDRVIRGKAAELAQYSKKEFMSRWRDFEKLYLAAMDDMEKQSREITEQILAYGEVEKELEAIINKLIENQKTFVTVRDLDKTGLQNKYLSVLAELYDLLGLIDGQPIELNINKIHNEYGKKGIKGLKNIVTKADRYLGSLNKITAELVNYKQTNVDKEQKNYIELVQSLSALKNVLTSWRDKKYLEINIAILDALLVQIDEGLEAQYDPKTDFLSYLESRNLVLTHLENNVTSFINEIEAIELIYKKRSKEVDVLLNQLDVAWGQYLVDQRYVSEDLVQKCSNVELAMQRLNSISDVKEKLIPGRKSLSELNKYVSQVEAVKNLLDEVLLALTKNKAVAQQAEEKALKIEEVKLRQTAKQSQEMFKCLLALNVDITTLQANLPKIFNTTNINDFVSFNMDKLLDRYFTLKRSAADAKYENQTLNTYINQQVKPVFKEVINKGIEELVKKYQDAINKLATLSQNELANNLIENCRKRDEGFIQALTKLGVFGESIRMRQSFEPITSQLFLIDEFMKMPVKQLTATISKLQSLFADHSKYIINQVSAFAEDESKTIEEKEGTYAALLKTINELNTNLLGWQNESFIGFNEQTILDYLQRIEQLNQAKNSDNTPRLTLVNAQISIARILKSDIVEYLISLQELKEKYHNRISKIKKQITDLNKHIEEYNELKIYATAQEFEKITAINGLIQKLQTNLGHELNIPNNLHAVKLTEAEDDITSLNKRLVELLPTLRNQKSKIESKEKAQRKELARKLEISLAQLQDGIKKVLLLSNNADNLLLAIPAILKPVNSLTDVTNLKIDKIIKEELTLESLNAAIQEVSAYSQDIIEPAILKLFVARLDLLAKEYQIASEQYDAIKLNNDSHIKNTLQECEKFDKKFSESIYKLGFTAEIIKNRAAFTALTPDLFLSNQVIELSASDFSNRLKELTNLVESHKNQVLSTIDAYKSAEIKATQGAKVAYEEALAKLKNSQSRYQQILNLSDSPDLTVNNALLVKISEIETNIGNSTLSHNDATLAIQEEISNLEKNLARALTNLLNTTLEPYHAAVAKLTADERAKSTVPLEVKNLYQLLLLKAPSHLTQLIVQINTIANATNNQFADFIANIKDHANHAVNSVNIEKDRLLQLAESEKQRQLELEKEEMEKKLIEEQQKKRDKEEQVRLRKEKAEKALKEKEEQERLKKEQDEKARKQKEEKERLKKEQEEKARKEKEEKERLKKEQEEKSRKEKEEKERLKREQEEKARKEKEEKERLKKEQEEKARKEKEEKDVKVEDQAPDQTSTVVANKKVSTAKIKQGLEVLFSGKEKPVGDNQKPEAAKNIRQESSQLQFEKNRTLKKSENKMDVDKEGITFKDLAIRQKKAVLCMDNIIRQIRAQRDFDQDSQWLLTQLEKSLDTNDANKLRTLIVVGDTVVDGLFNSTMENFAQALEDHKKASTEKGFSFIRFFKVLFGISNKIPVDGEIITIKHSKTYSFICDMKTTYCSTPEKQSQAMQSINLAEAFISNELRDTKFYYEEPSYSAPKRKADQKSDQLNQQVTHKSPSYLPPNKVLTNEQAAALGMYSKATKYGQLERPVEPPLPHLNPNDKTLKISNS